MRTHQTVGISPFNFHFCYLLSVGSWSKTRKKESFKYMLCFQFIFSVGARSKVTECRAVSFTIVPFGNFLLDWRKCDVCNCVGWGWIAALSEKNEAKSPPKECKAGNYHHPKWVASHRSLREASRRSQWNVDWDNNLRRNCLIDSNGTETGQSTWA